MWGMFTPGVFLLIALGVNARKISPFFGALAYTLWRLGTYLVLGFSVHGTPPETGFIVIMLFVLFCLFIAMWLAFGALQRSDNSYFWWFLFIFWAFAGDVMIAIIFERTVTLLL